MKFAILIVLATIVATQARVPTNAEENLAADYRAECRLKIGITLAEGIELREGHFDTASEKQKCYLRCLATIFDYIDKNGLFNEKKVLHDVVPLIGRQRAKKVINDCRNIVGTDPCDTTAKIYACHYAQNAVFSL